MKKYLTVLAILFASISGVAQAQCGPNGCNADSRQFNAIYGNERPASYNDGNNSSYYNNYSSGYSKPCNCSRN